MWLRGVESAEKAFVKTGSVSKGGLDDNGQVDFPATEWFS